MKAIIICNGPHSALLGMDEHQPGAMLPLGDRPFLQHVVEYLILAGSRECDFVLTHVPEKIEDHFGDGSRWGCRFKYHLAGSENHAWRMLRNICGGYDGSVLLASGDVLPLINDLSGLITSGPSALCGERDGKSHWSGWACFDARKAGTLFGEVAGVSVGEQIMMAADRGELQRVSVDNLLDFATPEGMLQSQHGLIAGELPHLMLNGNKSEKGICIGNGATIHPTAQLTAPLYVGANCRIGARAVVGPNAVVSENCIVDDDTSVIHSMITAGTYVGQGLELDGVLLDRNRLVNARLGTACLISESFLVGSLSGPRTVPFLRGLSDRVVALALYFLTLPLLLLMSLRTRVGSLSMQQEEFVQLPTGSDMQSMDSHRRTVFRANDGRGAGWQHFTREFLPGLISVFRGQLNLVGVPPRSAKAIQQMPEDWRSVYLSCKAGLITESLIVYGPNPRIEEAYSADAFYCGMESASYDCRLLLRYFGQILCKPRRHTADFSLDCGRNDAA